MRSSARDRLEGLIDLQIGGAADTAAMLTGHPFLLSVLLAQQGHDLQAGIPVTNRVDIARLDKHQRSELNELLKTIQALPSLLRDLMFG